MKMDLCSAVKNKSLNRLESGSTRQKYTNRFWERESTQVDSYEMEQEEFRNHLFICIERLPFRCKEAFMQSRFDKLKQRKNCRKSEYLTNNSKDTNPQGA